MRVSGVLPTGRESDTSETNTNASQEELEPDQVEERFRVDRKKLEEMLQGPTTEAEEFFDQIMMKTETVISWPSKIKIGAKSKKDPYVKVVGKIEAVKEAKSLVMAQLDIKMDRVTLKIDVPHTDHSHIIGKRGLNIQKVMNETSTRIHFPDSNRNNPIEKSNMVSIGGSPLQVERARAGIRDLVPLCFSFQVPVHLDTSSPLVRQIQEMYNVIVNIRHHTTYSAIVTIKGNEADAKNVKDATRGFMECLIGVSTIPVILSMEIGPQHHSFVYGRDCSNINVISRLTHTHITFPEVDPILLQPKKGTITISGPVEGVYLARQKIIGSLPITLMFDLRNDVTFDPTFVDQIMKRFDVNVTIKPKLKQCTKTIAIKACERRMNDIFETRRCLLNAEFMEPTVPTLVPASYFLPDVEYHNDYLMAAAAPATQPAPPPLIPAKMLWTASGVEGFPLPYAQHLSSNSASVCGERAPSASSSTATSTLTSPDRSPREGSPITQPQRFVTSLPFDKDVTSLANRFANTSITRLQELLDDSHSESSLLSSDSSSGRNSLVGDEVSAVNLPQECDRKQLLATMVVKEKSLTASQRRIPSANWVGHGFSKSMPEEMLKEKKRNYENLMNGQELANGGKLWQRRNVPTGCRPLSFCNSLDSCGSNAIDNDDLSDLLFKIGCEEYIKLFQDQEVDLATFLTMNESDFEKLGISKFGARRKMSTAIKAHLRFSAAPGAERKSSLKNVDHMWNGPTHYEYFNLA